MRQKDCHMVASKEQMVSTQFNQYGFGRERKRVDREKLLFARREGIAQLVQTGIPEMAATLKWDFEMAPITTDAEKLKLVCVHDILPESMSEAEAYAASLAQNNALGLRACLIDTIEGLADLGTFLINTDSYSDAELMVKLWKQVLRDAVRDIPPGCCAEFIDMDQHRTRDAKVVDRDRWMPKP
jgi:hypothetical protein